MRAGLSLTSKVPNPETLIFSPATRPFVTAVNTASITSRACVFVNLASVATASTNSFVII